MSLKNRTVLLIVSGGIAAVKIPELIRLIRKVGGHVRCILTNGGAQFVTPLSLASLSEHHVYTDLWSLKDETEMGHIRLSREADIILVAPASANIIAKMAHGLADDLATTTLLAADKPVMIAPAMNYKMWEHDATQTNIKTLQARGVNILQPDNGEMACGEVGVGRMMEPPSILAALENFFASSKPLNGKKAIVTAGPTREMIDPVRYISNFSSGKQGYAIAEALHDAGADVILITGPTDLAPPPYVTCVPVTTAQEMLDACVTSLPADIAVCAAAVADWGVENPSSSKMKKRDDGSTPQITLTPNPDILKTLSHHINRPALVIGFAAETENTGENALKKLRTKECDWVVANQVGDKTNPVFGSDENTVMLVTRTQIEDWPRLTKKAVAARLVQKIMTHFKKDQDNDQSSNCSRHSVG
jgi:phosphopantothenoylcysteine decarboxylase / phosphopantothenate---cysteine ligase